ncbi:MAG: serine peptidase [Gammaproteobacteria bacterium]|nr:serine peptidase [Gammaproteobacteria bacterium]|tara:strand:+ start:2473 stop:3867 length:1395 start_codon:yes stop_codon:yes gene_type:complete
MRVFSYSALVVWGILASSVQAAALPDFTELVKDNEAAVVNISTVGEAPSRMNRRGPRNDQLEEFFRRFGPPQQRENQPRLRPRSLGSGFIIESDGYILTNNHVVDGAEKIMVRLSNREEYEAELVGTDPRSDLALLKVSADKRLPALTMGDSDELEVGEWVLAIGSPFGFDYSVTAGIVSAKGRSLSNPQTGNYVPFIQTDVAINPGNSGGPLFNLDGEVVGINSQIYSNSGGFMGVSFAIPIEMAMDVVKQLKDKGRVSRGWLGVEILEVSRDLALSYGLERPRGALVARVMEGSPAADAGLQEEDIIVEFNGQDIERSGELPQYVGRAPVGEPSRLTVVRGGKKKKLSVTIGELPDQAGLTSGPKQSNQDNKIGLTVRDLSEQTKEQLGVDSGVEVVAARGLAGEAGLMPRDIILRMRTKPVVDSEALDDIIADVKPGSIVPVLVLRQQRRIFLTLKVPEDD